MRERERERERDSDYGAFMEKFVLQPSPSAQELPLNAHSPLLLKTCQS